MLIVEYVKKIELEIIYREDDEKRSNYTKIRSMDPLKNRCPIGPQYYRKPEMSDETRNECLNQK